MAKYTYVTETKEHKNKSFKKEILLEIIFMAVRH